MTGFVFDSSKAVLTFDTGAYEATIKRAGFKQAESGTMYVNLLWEDVDGRSIWDKLFFTEKSIKRAVAFLEAIGRVGELDGKTIDQAFLTQWAESLLGESATLDIEMKWSDYRNASEPNVKWYRPLDSITTADDLLDSDDLLDLDESLL